MKTILDPIQHILVKFHNSKYYDYLTIKIYGTVML